MIPTVADFRTGSCASKDALPLVNQLPSPRELERPLGQSVKPRARPGADCRSRPARWRPVSRRFAWSPRPARSRCASGRSAFRSTWSSRRPKRSSRRRRLRPAPRPLRRRRRPLRKRCRASTGPSIIRIDPDDDAAAASKNVVIIRDPSAIGQNLRIAHLPDKALIEPSRNRAAADPLGRRAPPVRRLCAAVVGSARRARGDRHRRARRLADRHAAGARQAAARSDAGLRRAGQQPRPLDAGGASRRPRDRHAGAARAVRLPQRQSRPQHADGRCRRRREHREPALVAVAHHQLHRHHELHGRPLLRRLAAR